MPTAPVATHGTQPRVLQMEQEAGERAAVGVTTGRLLCACVGSRNRAEYTLFGDAINLAARYAWSSQADRDDAITIDTQQALHSCTDAAFSRMRTCAVVVNSSYSPCGCSPVPSCHLQAHGEGEAAGAG